jgi:FlaA1/EpsC-like NDP-sugar epimerase
MAAYWSAFADRVRAFEATHPQAQSVAIYGSGFYGTFIATCLHHADRVSCFLDQNPHRQSQRLLDKPILSPEKLPATVSVIYVGLNPRIAREGIQSVAAWQGLAHDYFFP